MMGLLRDLGARVVGIEMSGDHDDYRSERLVVLLAVVLPTMFLEMSRPVEAKGKTPLLWGWIKIAS